MAELSYPPKPQPGTDNSEHTYDRPRRYTVAVEVIDIFGNDTMALVPVSVG